MVALGSGCWVENPLFDGGATSGTSGLSGLEESTTTTTTSGLSQIDASSAGEGSEGDSEGTGGQLSTTLAGAMTLSGGEATTEEGTSGETTESGGTTAESSGGEATTAGGEEPWPGETLRHFPKGSCGLIYGCFSGGYPAPARAWSIECFTAPVPPPFVVTRVGASIGGLNGSPPTDVKFYNVNGNTLEGKPFAERELGPIDSLGMKSFPIAPVPIATQEFCVGIVGRDDKTQVIVGIDAVSKDGGKSFFQLRAPGAGCDVGPALLEGVLGVYTANWCVEVDIAPP